MLRVNLANGRTMSFNLDDSDDHKRWINCCSKPDFQNSIRGVIIRHDGKDHALPVPSNFRNVSYDADLLWDKRNERVGGERVTCYADKIRVTLVVFRRNGAVRVDMARIGKRRHIPPVADGALSRSGALRASEEPPQSSRRE